MSWGIVNDILTAPDMNSDVLRINMDQMIHMLNPDFSSIYSFLKAMGKTRKVDSHKFQWVTDKYMPFVTQADGAVSEVATSFSVDNGDIFNINDRLQNNNTGEVMLVTDISSDTLTVTRGYGTTAAASITNDDYIINLHNSNALGSDTVKAKMTKLNTVENYVEIFKRTSKIDKSSAKHGQKLPINPRLRRIQKAGVEHIAGIERAFLFGEKKVDSSTYDTIAYNTGGIFSFITSNVVTDADGALSKTEFIDWMENYLFANGSDRKLVVCGSIITQALAHWFWDKTRLSPEFKKLGVSVTEFVTPSGKIAYFKHHELFKKTPALQGTALGLDVEELEVCSFRPNTLNMNIQSNSVDAYVDEWLAEEGISVGEEARHSVLKGVTSYT
jgi:hypothetical protein